MIEGRILCVISPTLNVDVRLENFYLIRALAVQERPPKATFQVLVPRKASWAPPAPATFLRGAQPGSITLTCLLY